MPLKVSLAIFKYYEAGHEQFVYTYLTFDFHDNNIQRESVQLRRQQQLQQPVELVLDSFMGSQILR